MARFTFCEPQSFDTFVGAPAQHRHPGVYVLGFRFKDETGELGEFLPYYVGRKHKDVRGRVIQHMIGIEQETHRVYKKERLADLRNWQEELDVEPARSDDLAYHNRATIDGEVCGRKVEMSPGFNEGLREHVEFYRANMFVTCAEVSEQDFPDKKRRDQVVDWLEQRVKSAIGRTRVLGYNIGTSLLGMDFGEVVVPACLSYALRGGEEVRVSTEREVEP